VYGDYAREQLLAALSGLVDDASDAEVIAAVEHAAMAVHLHYGSTEPITLDPTDLAEHLNRRKPECICPPGLVARGGFRSGCPIHHLP
jgi:hypothetical protein